MKSAPDLPAKNFTAMLRLDHNRAASQIAAKTGCAVGDIRKLTVWGNHSPTMYADYRFATVSGKSVRTPSTTRCGTLRCSCPPWASAAPPSLPPWPVVGSFAANAAIDHMRDWAWAPTADGSPWAYPFQWRIRHSCWHRVRLPRHHRKRRIQDRRRSGNRRLLAKCINKTLAELQGEADGVKHLL